MSAHADHGNVIATLRWWDGPTVWPRRSLMAEAAHLRPSMFGESMGLQRRHTSWVGRRRR
ncbi:hypothetical protein ACWEKT_39070 [Nocardia takedensis]